MIRDQNDILNRGRLGHRLRGEEGYEAETAGGCCAITEAERKKSGHGQEYSRLPADLETRAYSYRFQRDMALLTP